MHLCTPCRNLLEEPRASLVVQMPGWTGLANARVTIFGDIYQLPPDMQVGVWAYLVVNSGCGIAGCDSLSTEMAGA